MSNQDYLYLVKTPSRISVHSRNTLSNPQSTTNCALGKIFLQWLSAAIFPIKLEDQTGENLSLVSQQ